MTAAGDRREALRWGICFTLAVVIHVGGAAALLARWTDSSDLASAPVITIELAPIAATPDEVPNDVTPEREQVKPEPEKKVEPEPQTELQVTPPPKPKEEKPKEQKPRQASLPTTASKADQKAVRAAVQNWQSLLVSKIERAKRYPAEARARGEQGVAQLAFSIDRNGGVHNARITRSSGSTALDRETLQLIERAAPLPPPPATLPGAQIAIVVPIRYSMR